MCEFVSVFVDHGAHPIPATAQLERLLYRPHEVPVDRVPLSSLCCLPDGGWVWMSLPEDQVLFELRPLCSQRPDRLHVYLRPSTILELRLRLLCSVTPETNPFPRHTTHAHTHTLSASTAVGTARLELSSQNNYGSER